MTEREALEALRQIQETIEALTKETRKQIEESRRLRQELAERTALRMNDDQLIERFADIIRRPGDLTDRDLQDIAVIDQLFGTKKLLN